MSDKQPLLVSSKDKNTGNTKQKSSIKYGMNSFLRCCQSLGSKWRNGEYEKLDNDNGKHSRREVRVGLFQLFRFANCTDLILLSISLCAALVFAFCLSRIIVLVGRIASIFAFESLNNNSFIQSKNGCPGGIDSLCNGTNHVIPASSIDVVVEKAVRNSIMDKLYRLLVLGSIQIICTFIQCSIFDIVSKRQGCRMQTRLLQSLIQRNISYFDKHTINRINVKLFDNINIIERGIGFELAVLILTGCVIISNIIVSFVIDWKLTLILLCIIPLVIGGLYLFSKINTKETMKELNSYSKAGQIVEEVFSSIRTVFSLNGQKFEQKRYETELLSVQWSCVRKGAILGLLVGWLYFTIHFIYFLAFLAGSRLMIGKGCSIANVSNIPIIAILYAGSITFLGCISPCFQSLNAACCAAAQIFDLIDEAKATDVNELDIWRENTSDSESTNINGDIEFFDVNFAYPTRKDITALNKINLVARAGKTTAIVGQSGCGKSTCISLLLRYYEPSSGQIKINDQSITEYNIKQLRKHIGVVSQEPMLFNTSIYENICYGKENSTKAEVEEASRQANAHDFIMQLPNKYETLVGERGIQLSGGEKQRVALARILIKQPTILLLDEATSALDNHSEKIVQEALDQACENRTTIVIAHRLSTIQNADCIYVFDKGNIIEHGTHSTLMEIENGIYKQMVNIQQMEPIDEDINENIIETEMQREDEKKLDEHSHLLTNNQHDDINKKQISSSNNQSNFLRLLSMNKPEWISILIGCIMSTIAGICQIILVLLLPKVIIILTDCLFNKQSNKIIIASCLFLVIGVVILIVRFFQFTAFAVSGSKLTERIRAKAFATLLHQEVAYFDQPENSSNAISNRLSTDARSIQQMTGPRLSMICEALVMIVIALVLSFVLHYQLGLILFIYLTFIILILYLNICIRARITRRSEPILGRANALTGDVLDNMRTIKHLTAEKKVLQQSSNLIKQSYIIQRNSTILSALTYSIIFSTYAYASVAIFWRAYFLFEHNQLNRKNLIMVFAFVPFLLEISQVFWIIIEDGGTLVSGAQGFFDLFDRIPIIDNGGSTQGEELSSFRGDIEFDQVKFTYASRSTSPAVLNNFRLSIKQGQRVALIGASGCGKSTVVQLLERFYDVTHGHLRLDGVDIRQLNIHWVRSCFGLVGQEPILFDMTIAENISYPKNDVTLEDIIDAATKANIHQFIQQLPRGYETRVGSKGHQLSGGEKQRIAIARALFRRPKVLLLDEATSAMDLHNEQAVQQALEQIQNENSSQTMLIIAHRLSTIRSCDLICVLQNGHIIENGTHTDLIQRRGPYYAMLTSNTL